MKTPSSYPSTAVPDDMAGFIAGQTVTFEAVPAAEEA